jgi:hypothetical protein
MGGVINIADYKDAKELKEKWNGIFMLRINKPAQGSILSGWIMEVFGGSNNEMPPTELVRTIDPHIECNDYALTVERQIGKDIYGRVFHDADEPINVKINVY